MKTLLFTIGYLICFFISIEIVRSWKFTAETNKESFLTDSQARKIIDQNQVALDKVDAEVSQGEYALAQKDFVTDHKSKLDGEQDTIRQGFLDLIRVKVRDLQNSVVTGNGETEYKLASIMRKIASLDKNKQSASDFDSIINTIHTEIDNIKSTTTTQSAAFDVAMNRALDAEAMQQYRVVKDIQNAYALKSEQVSIENKINNIVGMKSQVDDSINKKTLDILEQIQSLKDIDDVVKDFQTNNMTNANGELVNKRFIDQLDRLHSDAMYKIDILDKKADMLKLCEVQGDIVQRVSNAEKSIESAKTTCESSKLVCEVAKGSETIFMKPGGNIMLGESGRYLTMREGDLEVCEKDGVCKTIVA